MSLEAEVKFLTDRVEALVGECHTMEKRVKELEGGGWQSSILNKLKKHWKALMVNAGVLFVFAILVTYAALLFSKFAASASDTIGTFDVHLDSWKAVALWLGTLISTTWAAVAVIALLTSRDRG